MGDSDSGSESLVKQDGKQVEDNPMNLNPDGKGGFADNPQNINKKGRPPKGWAWSEIFEDLMELTEEKSGKKYKELVSLALLKECINGNVLAIRELFNRMEGLPRIKVEHSGNVDTGLAAMAESFQALIKQRHGDKDGSDRTDENAS